MSLALHNITGPFFKLDAETMQSGISASRKSSRRRVILPIHRTQDALVQRMINFLQTGTFIRPHKHPLAHAAESLILLKGSLRFFIFDDMGIIDKQFDMDENDNINLIDIEPQTWHNFIVTKPDTVIFEVKRGPYDPETDKEFADWSPEEGSQKALDFLRFLEK
ncbi:MAG: WbuC family cupin fold metalloprotein [Balneolales bacterium]